MKSRAIASAPRAQSSIWSTSREQRVALGEREVLVHAAGDGAGAVDLLARRRLDHLLAEPAHHHGLHREVGVLGRHGQHVPLLDRGAEGAGRRAVGAEQQVRARQVEEVQGVALEHLAVVHQPPDLLGGRRQLLAPDDAVHGLGGGQVVADRADAAQPLDDDRDLPVGPARG